MKIKYIFLNTFKNKLFKETFWSFATKGGTLVLYFLLNVYLVRTLGVEKFGTWSFFFSLLTIVFLVSYFGINASSRKYVAQYNKTEELNKVLKSSVNLRFVFSLFFAILLFVVSKSLAVFLGRPEFTILFLFSVPLVLLSGLVEFLKSIFIGLHRIKYNFIINSLEYGLKLILIFLFLNFYSKLFNILILFIVAMSIVTIVGFCLLYKNFYLKDKIVKENKFTREILRYSIPLFFVSIGFLIATEIDTIMLGILTTDTIVGAYVAAKQIIIKLPHISLAISMGVMPVFAKLNKDNKENLKKLFYKLLKINTLIFLPLVLAIIFLSQFFVPLIFGVEYNNSILPLQILSVYLVCFSFSIFLSSFLDYQGLAKKRAINLSFSMVLNIILNFVLIPRYGAVGAATATSISYLPYVILNWIEVKKVLN